MKRIILLCTVALGFAACAKPPQVEMDAAKAAVDAAAKNADIITYAPDSLRGAQEKMAAMGAELAIQGKKSALARNYEVAKTLAIETATAAGRAVSDAVAAKEQVKRDAAFLIEKAGSAIPGFQAKIYAAKRVRGIGLDWAALAQVVAQARTTLADAQKDFDSGTFAPAKAKADAVQDMLTAGEEKIAEATRISKTR